MENEKYLPELSNQIRLVGFDRHNSVCDEEREIFSKLVFLVKGNSNLGTETLEKKLENDERITSLVGNPDRDFLLEDDFLYIDNIEIYLTYLQELIDRINGVFSEAEQEEFEKQQAIQMKKNAFEDKINNLKF